MDRISVVALAADARSLHRIFLVMARLTEQVLRIGLTGSYVVFELESFYRLRPVMLNLPAEITCILRGCSGSTVVVCDSLRFFRPG